MSLPYVVIGNPENRRVTGFQEALLRSGRPEAHVVSWASLTQSLAPLETVPFEACLVRVDSWGESFEVERALLVRGVRAAARLGATVIPTRQAQTLFELRGRVWAPRQAHEGALSLLGDVHGVIARRAGWCALQGHAATVALFDKRATWAAYREAGLSVPDALWGLRSAEELAAAMAARGWTQAFVKLSCGSSASCLALVTRASDGALTVLTSLDVDGARRFNTLRVCTYTRPREVEDVLAFLFREGSHVERAVEKARLGEAWFDLRVLCIAGEPRFVVVRMSRFPITNLHLGGWRGSVEDVRRVCPAEQWDAALETCRRVAACHDTLHVGVDLCFERGFERHFVVEANAFGDLLPGLEVDGKDVYEVELDAADGWAAARR